MLKSWCFDVMTQKKTTSTSEMMKKISLLLLGYKDLLYWTRCFSQAALLLNKHFQNIDGGATGEVTCAAFVPNCWHNPYSVPPNSRMLDHPVHQISLNPMDSGPWEALFTLDSPANGGPQHAPLHHHPFPSCTTQSRTHQLMPNIWRD